MTIPATLPVCAECGVPIRFGMARHRGDDYHQRCLDRRLVAADESRPDPALIRWRGDGGKGD